MENSLENNFHQSAWVVFSGRADIWWLKILKQGYRHCSVLLHDGAHWITFDPMSNYTDILVHNLPADFDLPTWFSERGHTVIRAAVEKPMKPAPWEVFSCVSSVKRVLGIHRRFIITPWQLFRYLKKQQRNICTRNNASASDVPSNSNNLSQKGDFVWEV